jgi:hypothetical protein
MRATANNINPTCAVSICELITAA